MGWVAEVGDGLAGRLAVGTGRGWGALGAHTIDPLCPPL